MEHREDFPHGCKRISGALFSNMKDAPTYLYTDISLTTTSLLKSFCVCVRVS